MKRTVGILTGLATLGLGIYLGARAWAQPGGQPPQPGAAPVAAPPLRTRIAVINMVEVLKGYQKFQAFQQGLGGEVKKIDAYIESLRAKMTDLRNKYQSVTASDAREGMENEIRKVQREIQDKEEEARKYLGKQQSAILVQIYREVEETVSYYARSHDFEMVLYFCDAVNPDDFYSAANISRKIQPAVTMPFYVDQRMNITQPVIQTLNARFNPQGANQAQGQPGTGR